ncbi:glucose-dependent insulinotropic receptor-like [Stylophora pistillata]|uniref:glucose-dependent insulinotropic receptor-like n=1 Tax=Stylophora pistillata TaxID=50429 RepID=UPI000C03B657|nr:glucose-dependent insulinotropic receptor-like [Stylophora pistillata]
MTSTDSDTESVPPLEVSYIISIIFNSIACPFTVLLNVRVIMAVKARSRLRTNSNILLACLAVTDALTGLVSQPLYILWKIFQLFGLKSSPTVKRPLVNSLSVFMMASYLHLILVTFERLIAIKFTMLYSKIVTDKKMKMAVLVVWIIAFMCGVFSVLKMFLVLLPISILITVSCVVFVAFAYAILLHETRRHRKKIKAQQLLQEEVERFTKENKALKTTVFVVGAVLVCLLPFCFCQIVWANGSYCPIDEVLLQPIAMFNSLANPLIYCWRQKEMRNFIFRKGSQVVHPVTSESGT